MSKCGQFFDEILNDLKTELLVRHFAAAETQSDLHLHVFAEKVDGVRQLDPKIVRINGRAELHFLYFIGVLALFGFFVFLGLLVTELAVVNKAADGRRGVWRDLDEIDTLIAREIQRVLQRQDAILVAVSAQDAYFAGTDFAVYPCIRTARRLWTRKRAIQAALTGWSFFIPALCNIGDPI